MYLRRDATTSGVVLNMTMLGDGIYNCAYVVPALVGEDKKQINLQIDSGSSDIWLVSSSCNSKPSCTTYTGPKYDQGDAHSTGQSVNLAYQRGSVTGPIVLDRLEIGEYVVNKQAMVSGTDIENENLQIGTGFGGLIGLAPQANSLIAHQMASSNSQLDKSTFATHLFTNASVIPTNHFFSLLLERPYYPAIASRLGVGMHPTLPYSLSPSAIQYSDILPSSPGPLLWRVPLSRISIDLKGTTTNVQIGGSIATGVYSINPVAVFDSGGTTMLATRYLANAIYGSWGIGPGQQDKQYYVPCDLAMNVTFTLGSGATIDVPIHPLDMSYYLATEPGGNTCLGALQATDDPIPQGDLILGAAFMRNMYTVMSWQSDPPKLGILPLTTPSVAFSEFNTVRVQKQTLSNSQSQTSNNSLQSDGNDNDNKSTMFGVKMLGIVLGILVVLGLAMWFGARTLAKRWKKRGIEEPIEPLPEEITPTARRRMTKYDASRQTMFGLEIDEPYSSYHPPSPNQAREPTEEGHENPQKSESDHAVPLARPRFAPYESVDHLWSGENMSDAVRKSIYSVHSSTTNIIAMEPTDTYKNQSGIPPVPVSPFATNFSNADPSERKDSLSKDDKGN